MMEDKKLIDANFDLEQNILRCWNIIDDLKEILDDAEAGTTSTEEAFTALRAYATIYQNRFERTWTKYETVCRGLHELRHAYQDGITAEKSDNKSGKKSGKNVQKVVDQ